jgi:hypothetical protein
LLLYIDCAELLYLHFLADPHVVGDSTFASQEYAGALGSVVGVACCYFATQDEVDAAVEILSCTTWDTADKPTIVEARYKVTLLLGFVHAAADLMASVERSEGSTGGGASEGPGGRHPEADELDSYEALVRDAGIEKYIFNLCWSVLNVIVLFISFVCRLLRQVSQVICTGQQKFH